MSMQGNGCIFILNLTPTRVHDTSYRQIREIDFLDLKVILHVPVRRIFCNFGGPKEQQIEWLEPVARIIKRLQSYAESLCKIMPIKHVAQLLNLSWHTVKNIDKKRLQAEGKLKLIRRMMR